MRVGVVEGIAGAGTETGRDTGTGTGPDFPGMRNRASNSCGEPAAHVVEDASVAGSAVTGSGVLAVAAIGGGVDARRRRRSSAAEIDAA